MVRSIAGSVWPYCAKFWIGFVLLGDVDGDDGSNDRALGSSDIDDDDGSNVQALGFKLEFELLSSLLSSSSVFSLSFVANITSFARLCV